MMKNGILTSFASLSVICNHFCCMMEETYEAGHLPPSNTQTHEHVSILVSYYLL